MANEPTHRQIEEAKQFLKKRLTAEQSMSNNLEKELVAFANLLASLFNKYGIADPLSPDAKFNEELQRQIKQLIKRLIERLTNAVDILADSAFEDDDDSILPFIHMEHYGMTLDSRIEYWADKTSNEILNDFHNNGVHMLNAITLKIGGGAGLDKLLRHTVAIGYMQSLLNNNKNADGFYSYRGSTYPCELCDSEVGWHPIADYPLGGWHPNCKCIFVIVKG